MDSLTLRLIVYSIFLICCIVAFILRFFRPAVKNMFFEFEIFAFWGSMVYYLVMVVVDLLRVTLNKTFDNVSNFFNQKVFKFVWACEMTAGLGYWGAVILHGMQYTKGNGTDAFLMFYYHLIIQIFLIVDLFLFNHTLETSYLADFITITVIYLVLGLYICICNWCGLRSPIYWFLGWGFDKIFVIGVIFYMLLLNMYFLHQLLLMKKMNVTFGTTTVTEMSSVTRKGKTDTFV